MKVEVSIGEAVDKYSILELKKKKIGNAEKIVQIEKELESLRDCTKYITEHNFFYQLLVYVNGQIWDMTDTIKNLDVQDPQFASIANSIFEFNQKRFRLKNMFNILCSSDLKEQKSYSESVCTVIIDSQETLYNKIAEINFLSIEYDFITFQYSNMEEIQRLFKQPNISYSSNASQTIILQDFKIDESLYSWFKQK